ncbi:hypothetical protein Dimus_008999 [Dionaea muscipula]
MRSGGGDRGGFRCSGKGEIDCDVGLGLKMQRGAPDSCPQYKNNHMHAALAEAPFAGFPPGGVCSGHQAASPLTAIHDAAGASSAASGQRTVPNCCFPPDSSFKSWAGGVGSDRAGAPFTASQRQELERQTAIYKYMMSSAPVPPELLLPVPKYSSEIQFSTSSKYPNDQCSRGKNSLDLRFASSSSKDLEPWRCRRTDGKKWRCSRDVAPDQKYCERHTHKGRPSRSRKPVELQSPLKSQSHPYNISTFSSAASASDPPLDQWVPSVTKSYQNQRPSFLDQASQYNQTRYSDSWLMKREAAAAAALRVSTDLYQNLDQMVHSGGENQIMRENCASFGAHATFSSLPPPPQGKNHGSEQSQAQGMNPQSCLLPRQFLDAWSLGEDQDGHIGKITRNSSSNANLTLSISAGDRSESRVGHAPNWMSPVGVGVGTPWMCSPPGGPLAEALCLGIAGGAGKGGSDDASASKQVSTPPHGAGGGGGRSSSTSAASSSKTSHDDGSNLLSFMQ